jgi:hypothetical protein
LPGNHSVVDGSGKKFFHFPLERHPAQNAVSRAFINPERVHDFLESKLGILEYDPAVIIPLGANEADSIIVRGGQETPPEIEWLKGLAPRVTNTL